MYQLSSGMCGAEGMEPTLYSRRTVTKMIGAGVATATLLSMGFKLPQALADDEITFPLPTGALYDTVDGKTVLKCYAPATLDNFSELLGLNDPSFYATEYNAYIDTGLGQSPTLGLWGSSWNAQPNAFFSNLVYRDEVGGDVDDDYVAVLGSALQGIVQGNSLSDEDGGIPLFMHHRPELYFVDGDTSWNSSETRTLSEFVQTINEFDPDGDYYHDGDEDYDPDFVDGRGHYGEKLGYMYSAWDLALKADEVLEEKYPEKVLRYTDTASEMAAKLEEFMVASQYAVLRKIDDGTTHRKTVAVIGGISDQTQGVTYGVDTSTGRARLDKFDASTTDFASSTNWGTTTNYNVRYYHAAAALENCCDNIIDVLGIGEDDDSPIIEDDNGICWARPEALMQCEAIIIRTQTTVSTIPGTDELYQILNEYGYTDESEWPDIFTANPTIPGYGASNCGQLFWWSAFLGFVYPEVVNPVYMGAYLCENFYHIASTYLEDAFQLIYGETSLPTGVELSIADYNASDLDELFASGIEYYLFYKDSIDASYANLVMTDGMTAYLTDDTKDEMGIRGTIFTDLDEDDWAYDEINACAKAGLMTGYTDGSGMFGTYDKLSRAQAAAILCRYLASEDDEDASEWNTSTNTTGMPDVADDAWYTEVVNWAVYSGAMHGYDTGNFGPTDPLTRQQLCAIIANVAATDSELASAGRRNIESMPDVDDVSDWAYTSVAWALNKGLISGMEVNGTRYIRPKTQVNRSQMAAIIQNAINNGIL